MKLMTIEQAEKIISNYNESFKVGEKAFFGERIANTYKIYVVEIVSKRISSIGLPDCYSIKNVKTNKVIHSPHFRLFRKIEDAENYMDAVLTIVKYTEAKEE